MKVAPVCGLPGRPPCPGRERRAASADGSALSADGTLRSSGRRSPASRGLRFYKCPLGGTSHAEGQRPAYVLVQLLPKRASGGGPLAEQLQSQLRHSHGPHAVVQPARTQAALGDLEAPSLSW